MNPVGGGRRLAELAGIFLRLGLTAFGGPAAHIAMMEQEFVRRRAWLSRDEFVDLIGAAGLIPGPSSTEVAILVGFRREGVAGLVLAGVCFILPAALMVAAFAWAYVRFGTLPSMRSVLYGIKPVVVAVVAQAVVLLAAKVVDTWPKRVILAAAAVLSWLNLSALVVLFGAGIVLGGNEARRQRSLRSAGPLALLLAGVAVVAAVPVVIALFRGLPAHPNGAAVFLYFAMLGSVLYGSGYVLLAFLEHDLVAQLHWLSLGRVVDAIAVGQFTPGPVFTTATFIGYVLAGPVGAVAATVGIFLPAFLFVAIAGRALRSLRGAPVSAGFLDGVNAAAVALMAVVLVRLALESLVDIPAVALCAVALFALLKFKTNSAALIAAGAVAGVVLRAFGL